MKRPRPSPSVLGACNAFCISLCVASAEFEPTDVVVRGLRISSPTRVIYPKLGFSKLDLVRYYDRVGDLILPHVIDRPLTLVHCPDGLQSACNYMRHRKVWGPGVLRRVSIRE